ncbi:MAG: HypC/HybG/HupF family hydrogenase formation chaperone [Dethiobacteria bacterium]|jgi:hydrogenase expression/formation protein HypC
MARLRRRRGCLQDKKKQYIVPVGQHHRFAEVEEMCLAIPGKIVSIGDGYAEIDYGRLYQRASLRLVENVKVGDYALVHAGFVIQILDQAAGEELARLLAETLGGMHENEK